MLRAFSADVCIGMLLRTQQARATASFDAAALAHIVGRMGMTVEWLFDNEFLCVAVDSAEVDAGVEIANWE